MQREEKVRFVLEQMRLCLAKKDFVRAQIVSKKISTKFFSESESDEAQVRYCMSVCVFVFKRAAFYNILFNCQELKLKYYNLMIALSHHDDDYLAVCRHYLAMYQTPYIMSDEVKWSEVAMSVNLCVLYVQSTSLLLNMFICKQ